mgnify:CR=1 FL=1
MKISQPFVGFVATDYPKGSVTQWFGENHKLYYDAVVINGVHLEGHNGHDYVAPWGTQLLCVEGGIVCDVKEDAGGYGKHVRVFCPETKHEWTYGHLSFIQAKLGDTINAGDKIGLMGNTGFVVSDSNGLGFWKYNPYAGTHLHLGLRQMKYSTGGWKYPGMTKKVVCLNYDNGYFGGLDFKDMLDIPEVPKKTYASDDPVWWNNFLNLLKFLRLNSK